MLADESRTISWKAALLPNSFSIAFLLLLMALLLGCPLIFLKDGATCRHIMTGLYIFQHNQIPTVNYVWAIDPTYPWLTHEVASDILFAGLYQVLGLNGLVLVSALALDISLMWSYQIARLRGLSPTISTLAFLPVMLSTSLHWSARPHIFSYVFFLLLYYVGCISQASLIVRTTIAVAVSLLWVNCHASVMLGIFVLSIKPIMDILLAIQKKKFDKLKELYPDLIPAVAAAIIVCCNVRGPAFYSYVFGYLLHPQIIRQGGEWLPFSLSLGISSYCFLLVIAMVTLIYILAKRLPALWEAVTLFVLAFWGFNSMRIIPYFALVALPSLAPAWKCLMASQSKMPIMQVIYKLDRYLVHKHSHSSWKCALTICIALMISAKFLLAPDCKIQDFYSGTLPITCVTYLQKHPPVLASEPIGFNFDNWGPYLNFRLKKKVYIDDKTDFYPKQFVQEYLDTIQTSKNWQFVFNKYHLQYALLPKKISLDNAVAISPLWEKVCSDQVSNLYYRRMPSR